MNRLLIGILSIASTASIAMAACAQATSPPLHPRAKPTDVGALPPGATLDWQGRRVVMKAPFVIGPTDFTGWYPDISGQGAAVFLDPLFANPGAGVVLQGGFSGGNPSLVVVGGRVIEVGHNTIFESGVRWNGAGDATFIGTSWDGATLDYMSWYSSGRLWLTDNHIGPFCLAAPHDAHCEPFHVYNGSAWFVRDTWDMTDLRGRLAGGMTAPSVFAEGYTGPVTLKMVDNTFIGTDGISSPPGCAARCTTATLYSLQASGARFPVDVTVFGTRFIPGSSGHTMGISQGLAGVTLKMFGNLNAATGEPIDKP